MKVASDSAIVPIASVAARQRRLVRPALPPERRRRTGLSASCSATGLAARGSGSVQAPRRAPRRAVGAQQAARAVACCAAHAGLPTHSPR